MPRIKLSHVVAFSSEDPANVADNLLNHDVKKIWLNQNPKDMSANVTIQFERITKITGIDICNEGSCFIEVLVGRSGAEQQEFKSLLPMSSFMTIKDAREGKNRQRVRLFQYKDLLPETRDEKWDRVKINCSQPYNDKEKFGVAHLVFHKPLSEDEEDKTIILYDPAEEKTKEAEKQKIDETKDFGKFRLRPESPETIPVGSLFGKRKETISQELRRLSSKEWLDKHGPPKFNPILKVNDKPSTSTKKTESKLASKRNSMDVYYTSEDDEPNEKIDRVMAAKREEDERIKKEKELELSRKKKKQTISNEKNNNEASTSKRKIETTPKGNDFTPKGKDLTTKGKDLTTKGKDLTTKGNDLITKGKDLTPKGKDLTPKDTTPRNIKKKIKLETKPFNELLKGVVFTISGLVNPERGNLRDMALKMGAKYRPNWDDTCTHLVCAFANTPKFKEVQGKGKIVIKEWLKDCYEERKRLPWRRYALDKNDEGPESENEILEEQTNQPNRSDYDTDEEVDRILEKQKRVTENRLDPKKIDEQTLDNQNKDSVESSVDLVEDDPFMVDTDEENFDRNEIEIEREIPKVLNKEIFYIDDCFSQTDKKEVTRKIQILNGLVFKDSGRDMAVFEVDFIVTDNAPSGLEKRNTYKNARVISVAWINKVYELQKYVPIEKYHIT